MIEMTKTRLQLLLAACAAAPLLLSAGAAAAQAAPAAPAAESQTLEEVVVTAQKRTETLRQVPQSVSVVSSQTLQNQQVFDMQDLVAQVPGLNITQAVPGQGRVVLRGINTNGVASSVSVYMDETPFGSSSGLADGAVLAADFDTFDISRVEVLRGPQGTLYGASSLGGVLKYVTNAPQLGVMNGRAQAGIEGVDGGQPNWHVDAVVNAPLGDKAAIRASGYYRRDGGWINEIGTEGSLKASDVNWGEVYGGRASVLVKPVDKLSVRLTAHIQDIHNGAPTVVDADPVSGEPLYGQLTHTAYYPEFSNIDYRLYNGTIDYDFGFASLVSSTSYATLDQHQATDATSVQLAPGLTVGDIATIFFGGGKTLGVVEPQDMHQSKWTQELRLASPSGHRIEWLVGGYYTHETANLVQTVDAFDLSTLQTPTGVPQLEKVTLPSTYQEIAGFADATLHITKQLSLAVGGRYSHNKQSAVESVDGALVGGPQTFPAGNSSEDVFTYSVAPKFEINDHATVYARVAKGYRPGGPNVLPAGAPVCGSNASATDCVPSSYKADSLVSYEGGIKADFLDRRLSLDAALFYLDWTDIQLLARVNGFGVNVNGGTAASKGLEFSIVGRPAAGLTLDASGAITTAKLTEDTPALTGGLKGDRLPFVPNWSFTFGGDYERPIFDTYRGFAGATVQLVGPQFPGFDPAYKDAYGRRFQIGSYARLDLRAGVRKDRWTFEMYAKNITNSQGLINVEGYGNIPNNALGITPIRPRTFGGSLTASF
jgi:outer membrane receptor protein involved in Fe transport